jgi:ankyrin repeat protein
MNEKGWRVTKFKKKPRFIDQELLNASYFGNSYGVKKWIQKGANIEYMEERDGWLPIHYAARWGDLKMLNILIKAGANINGLTNSKESALHKCGRWDRKDAAIILLELGANPNIKNSDGKRASEMTVDPELKFMLDYYDQYKAIKRNEHYLSMNE